MNSKGNYRPEIDGLRAFAVVAVICNHLSENILPSGYLGVDVFFVISGYVITASLIERDCKGLWDYITSFYARRIKRLIPALVLFVLITSVFICLVNPSPFLALWTGLSSLFGLSNLYLLKRSADYFAQSAELNPFIHTWSLGVEEQFYLFFPFLLWYAGIGRKKRGNWMGVTLVLVGLSIGSLVGFAYLYEINQNAAYFLMPVRFWELAAGCMVFLTLQGRSDFVKTLESVPPTLVLSGMIATLFMPNSAAVFATVLIVILTSFLIFCVREGTVAFELLTARSAVYLGMISYSLYLWHWGVISISQWTTGIYWWTIPFQVTLMFLLAVFSYHFVELPLRRNAWFNPRWNTFIVGGGSVIASACMIVILGKSLHGFLYTGVYKHSDFVHVQSDMECELGGSRVSKAPGKCLARENVEPSIFVLGNSHASNLVPSLQQVSKDLGYFNVYYLTNVQMFDPDFWTGSKLFEEFSLSLGKNDLIVYSHSSPNLLKDSMSEQIEMQINVLRNLTISSGAKLVLVDDLPDFKESEFFPSFSLFRDGFSLGKGEAITRRIVLTNILKSYTDEKTVKYIDPFEVVCNEGQCPSVRDGKLMYADSSPHFTKEGAKSLVPLFHGYLPPVN
ncbi:MAG: acyltransferase [Sedimenticola sp.]|nr:acyltransferase [Sedimenticola sp.]